MDLNVQKASMWKRISAFLFDGIILGILAVALAWVLATALNFDSYNQTMEASYEKYAAQYGISFDITQADFDAMSQEQKDQFMAAQKALSMDEEANYAFNMMISLSLVIITFGLLASFLLLEFGAPLLIGNGQTMGKKIFGVALMRNDLVAVTPVALFIRTLLGKFAIETMIPVLILMMIFWGVMGVIGPMILGVLLIVQATLLIVTRNNLTIHDFLANTVAVDYASQMIFPTEQAMIEYKKKRSAEKAARQTY